MLYFLSSYLPSTPVYKNLASSQSASYSFMSDLHADINLPSDTPTIFKFCDPLLPGVKQEVLSKIVDETGTASPTARPTTAAGRDRVSTVRAALFKLSVCSSEAESRRLLSRLGRVRAPGRARGPGPEPPGPGRGMVTWRPGTCDRTVMRRARRRMQRAPRSSAGPGAIRRCLFLSSDS
eukprot:766655-Hanusia_phi.AAC.2